LEPAPYGLFLDDCRDTLITGCTILDGRSPPLMQAPLRWQGPGSGNLIAHCRLGKGTEGTILPESNVRQWDNLSS
jgi:hypothetical protein